MSINLDEVTFANEAFYLAFESKDFAAMSHIWSSEREVICLHPGWSALVGRRDVLDSWNDILSNPQQGPVSFYGARTIKMSDDTAAVICYE
ncbi:MAG: nuclear transport factor 2 family protein, partial [Pseudomonadales bacterium]|nr:nuclear transport factor 2 family protein [Pseudomonadales bacterium]